MKKKEYCSPEFSYEKLWLQDIMLASGPEELSSQITGGDDWGDPDPDDDIIE